MINIIDREYIIISKNSQLCNFAYRKLVSHFGDCFAVSHLRILAVYCLIYANPKHLGYYIENADSNR